MTASPRRSKVQLSVHSTCSSRLASLHCQYLLSADLCLAPGIPDEAWFCKGCLEKFGEAGPPAWTTFGPGDRCIATFEDDKNPESKAKWICKVLDIQVIPNIRGLPLVPLSAMPPGTQLSAFSTVSMILPVPTCMYLYVVVSGIGTKQCQL